MSILICSPDDVSRELKGTLIGRSGVDRFRARRLEEVRVLSRAVCPTVILVDRDMPRAAELVHALRQDAATQGLSVAILARGEMTPLELELLELGANAIFRLPPDAGWDERMSRLLKVPARQETRLPVRIVLETGGEAEESGTRALNLSLSGMLLESDRPLSLFHELSFSLTLPDGCRVAGRGRVVRVASDRLYGVEFRDLATGAADAIRQFVRSASIGD
jgi:CheY-like chemotaxis protein